jgi:hypothetical protein
LREVVLFGKYFDLAEIYEKIPVPGSNRIGSETYYDRLQDNASKSLRTQIGTFHVLRVYFIYFCTRFAGKAKKCNDP